MHDIQPEAIEYLFLTISNAITYFCAFSLLIQYLFLCWQKMKKLKAKFKKKNKQIALLLVSRKKMRTS